MFANCTSCLLAKISSMIISLLQLQYDFNISNKIILQLARLDKISPSNVLTTQYMSNYGIVRGFKNILGDYFWEMIISTDQISKILVSPDIL